MRYKKSEIRITPRDLMLLNTIARARFITRRQLTFITYSDCSEAYYPDKVRWRLERYLKENLIIETATPPEESFLTITSRGLLFLKTLDLEFATQIHGVDVFPPKPSSRFRSHEIALNELWMAFKRSGHLTRWITSFEIRLAAKKRAPASFKQYDALAVLETSRGPSQIAIEYERMPKSSRHYPQIISVMKADAHITLILYVCATDQLKNKLKSKFKDLPKVFFATERDILSQSTAAYVERCSFNLFPVVERLQDVITAAQPVDLNAYF